MEIENLFSRYDTDGDRVLRASEQNLMRSDLAAQESHLDNDIKDLGEPTASK